MTGGADLHLYDLRVRGEVLVTQSGAPFDAQGYSRFKFGEQTVARRYGYGLADRFAKEYPDLLESERPLTVTSSPYYALPKAAQSIAYYLVQAVNCHRVPAGLEPAHLIPMRYRLLRRIRTDHYAELGLDQRIQINAAMRRHMDSEPIIGANVLMVDDIHVTGTSQAHAIRLISQSRPASLMCVNACVLDAEAAFRDPGMEQRLNWAYRHSLDSIARDIQAGNFRLNWRVFRFLMGQERQALTDFLDDRSPRFLERLHTALLASGADFVRAHAAALDVLEHAIAARDLPLVRVVRAPRDADGLRPRRPGARPGP